MHCKECNLIIKGVETKCPYCGTPFQKEHFLDKNFTLFKNMSLTVKQFVSIICLNILAIVMIIDAVVSHTSGVNLRLTPWVFASVFGIVFIVNNFILKSSNSNKLLFFKFLFYSLAFSALFLIYYWNEQLFESVKNHLLVLGYLYPATIIILAVGGIVTVFKNRYYNIFSSIVYVVLQFLFSAILYILRFIKPIGLSDIKSMNLLIIVAFVLTCVCLFNTAIFTILTLKSKVTSED